MLNYCPIPPDLQIYFSLLGFLIWDLTLSQVGWILQSSSLRLLNVDVTDLPGTCSGAQAVLPFEILLSLLPELWDHSCALLCIVLYCDPLTQCKSPSLSSVLRYLNSSQLYWSSFSYASSSLSVSLSVSVSLFLSDRVSLCSPGTSYVDQTGLKTHRDS